MKKRASFNVKFNVENDISEDKPYRASKPKRVKKKTKRSATLEDENSINNNNSSNVEGDPMEDTGVKILAMVKNSSTSSIEGDSPEQSSDASSGSLDDPGSTQSINTINTLTGSEEAENVVHQTNQENDNYSTSESTIHLDQ